MNIVAARRRVFATLLCLLVAACDSGPGDTPSTSVRTDSAGVAIVTGPAEDQPIALSLTEVFRIGGNDSGPGSFSSAYAPLVATDASGRTYVLDSKQHRVEVFDSTGAHVRFVGQHGGGPGELQDVSQLFVHPDGSIGVSDYGKRAIVRWAADGSLLPEYTLGFFPANPLWLSGDTLVYVHEDYSEKSQTQLLRIASAQDTIGVSSVARATSGMVMFSCIGLNLPPMFSPALIWTGNAHRLATSRQVPYIVDVYEQGRLVRSVRRPLASQTPSVEHVNRLHPEGMKVGFSSGSCTVPAKELLDKQGVAEKLPLVEALQFDRTGRLWVQRFGIRDEPRSVDVFSANGEYVGTLTGKPAPLGFVGTDIALFPDTDEETGIVQIVAYRLLPTAAPK